MSDTLLSVISGAIGVVAVATGILSFLSSAQQQRRDQERISEIQDDVRERIHESRRAFGWWPLQPPPPESVVPVAPAEETEGAGKTEAEVRAEFDESLDRAESDLASAIAKAVGDATAKSWWERWGATVATALISAFAIVFAAFLGFIRSEPPDCIAYTNVLLAVHEQAPSSDAAERAVTSLDWGEVDEHCGAPDRFISELSEP